jgi:hypothetical protein
VAKQFFKERTKVRIFLALLLGPALLVILAVIAFPNGAITAKEAAKRMQREAGKNIADSNL